MTNKPRLFDIELNAMLSYFQTDGGLMWAMAGPTRYFYTLIPLACQYLNLVENTHYAKVILPEFQELAASNGDNWLASELLSELNQEGKLFEPYRSEFDRHKEYEFRSLTIQAATTRTPVEGADVACLLAERRVSLSLEVDHRNGSMGGGLSFSALSSYPFMPKRFLSVLARHVLRTSAAEYDKWNQKFGTPSEEPIPPYETKLPRCIKLEGDLAAWQSFYRQCQDD